MRLIRYANAQPPSVVGVCIFLICFLSIYPVHRFGLCTGDLAEYLNNPIRVLRGELPYRDFWLLFSPLEVFVPAWLYAVGGVNISRLLTANLTVNALAALAAFVVTRQLVTRNILAALAALLVFYLGPPRFTPCFVYPQHCLLFSMLGAGALIYHFRTDSRLAAFGAGLMFGLGMNWNLLMGAVPLSAAIIAMLLRLHRRPRPSGSVANLLLVMGAALLPLAIMALSLREIMPEAARALTLGTLTHGKSMPMPWLRDLQHCWGMAGRALHALLTSGNPVPLTVDGAHLLSIAASYALPLAVGLVLVFNWRNDWLSQRRDGVVFLTLWSALALPKFVARAGMGNLGYALCPPVHSSGHYAVRFVS